MKIPDKLILLGEEIQIIQLSKDDMKCRFCRDDWIGKYEPDKKIIYIATDSTDETPFQILLHELGHYFSNYYGMGMGEFEAEAYAKFTESIFKQIKLK